MAALEGGLDQRLGVFEGLPAHGLFAVFDDHLVDARVRRGRGAAEAHRAAGLGLQRQGCGLQHVGQRDVGVGVLGVQHADGGEQRAQAALEAGDLVHRTLMFGAFDDGLDGGVPAPEIGAAQGPGAGYVHDESFFLVVIVRSGGGGDGQGAAVFSARRRRWRPGPWRGPRGA